MERLDATPERLDRARDAGQTPTRDKDRVRRILDPFDTMRANRAARAARPEAQRHPLADRRIAAPHPSARPARRPARGRARPDRLDRLRAAPRPAAGRGGAACPRQAAQGARTGSAPPPGRSSRGSSSRARGCANAAASSPNSITPWRADAVISDRLRVALDSLGDLLGVTARGGGREPGSLRPTATACPEERRRRRCVSKGAPARTTGAAFGVFVETPRFARLLGMRS